MNEKKYESPKIEKVTVYLEHVIAGSIPVTTPDTGLQENWQEETIMTGDIEIIL